MYKFNVEAVSDQLSAISDQLLNGSIGSVMCGLDPVGSS
jgi:hypothetical protein